MQATLKPAPLLGLATLAALGLTAARPADAQSYSFHEITSGALGTPSLSPADAFSEAAGITNAGVVVGTVAVGPPVASGTYQPSEGYEYDTKSGAATLLNYQTAQGGSGFIAVSGDGTKLLGNYYVGGNGQESYFTDSGGSITALPEPDTLPGSFPDPTDGAYNGINGSGTTAGYDLSTNPPGFQGFLRSADGTLTTFSGPNGSLGGFAYGINDSGTTAGTYFTNTVLADGNNANNGFLRSADGTFTDVMVPGASDTNLYGLSDNGNLFGQYDVIGSAGNVVKTDNFTDIGGVFDTSVDVPGATYTDITGINDAGQISGYYLDTAGGAHSFYADPVPEASTVVSLGLLLTLGGGVAARRKKKTA